MQDNMHSGVATLEAQISERFGLLLTQTQPAEPLGRTSRGLGYSLSYPSDYQTRSQKRCGRKIGRRVYYPATGVAQITTCTSG